MIDSFLLTIKSNNLRFIMAPALEKKLWAPMLKWCDVTVHVGFENRWLIAES